MKNSIIKFALLTGLLVACQENPIKTIKGHSVEGNKKVNKNNFFKNLVKDKNLISRFVEVERKFFKDRVDLSFNNTKIYRITKGNKSALFVDQVDTNKESFGFVVALKEGKLYNPFMVKVSKINESIIGVDYYFQDSYNRSLSLHVSKKTKSFKLVYSQGKQANDHYLDCLSDGAGVAIGVAMAGGFTPAAIIGASAGLALSCL